MPGRDVCLEVPHGNARAISLYEYTWPAAAVSRYGDWRPASNTVPPPVAG
ncbi:hypothetical protein [Streptomyces sp. SID12501]|uniref:Uncharacterized protein n=1 Tax=Streptomyces sp. SID12501 TaxID=2706042 RepID=A0A6B3C035_9ACTN|nr:hypothetical protein [Streptomyces sp. SID12501]NEC89894.1 hypothetical protein [Streptomyces sp. SID12501]